MAFTFSPALTTALDRVRFALADDDADDPLLDDVTIGAVLAMAGTTAGETAPSSAEASALVSLAQNLLGRFGREVSSFSESGGISVSWAKRGDSWKAIVEGKAGGALPGFGVAMVAGAYRLDVIEPIAAGA